ncbi:hypothetical protein EYZ11_002203 [Aspergillus tanneri]|uniref:Enoyl reductase (ER) domain-containing protein n=1 Tax=Aspergillus tanneri TaxID=1220188 RepID=A0A4S3JRI3_9EURO|nr:uncharacterized protein ATNIH1004_008956 [Aspergillus tanneri]KAA8644749.1 hypothetical protein ATNIH1004_008956 [Aspergillus tanneri]THC98342.1 hypothetical protein EYZ11_002203 [Aspergillus tanneri]
MDEQTFIPGTMRALYHCPASTARDLDLPRVDSEIVFDSDFPTPKPAPNQYLIKVQTAAFSHDELRLVRELNPSKSIPHIPLHNFCGTVIGTPSEDLYKPDGPKFKVSDVVFGLINHIRDGAAADYVVASEDEIALKPKNISAAEAATIPLPALTAWQALFMYSHLDPTNADDPRRGLRVLVTNAHSNQIGTHMVQFLRSPSLFPYYRPWVCATCSGTAQEYLRTEALVDEVIDAPLPVSQEFDLPSLFRQNRWDPVDIVLDCAGMQTFKQAHSPEVVKDYGAVLTAVDSSPVHGHTPEENAQCQKRGLLSRFIAVQPDGKALGRIAMLVEENSVRGRVETITDFVNGADVLESGAACAGGGRRGGMMVFRVNI